jgi:hypothetical protein
MFALHRFALAFASLCMSICIALHYLEAALFPAVALRSTRTIPVPLCDRPDIAQHGTE